MTELYMTAYNGSILGPIAKLLGWIMDKIYVVLSLLGIENIALTIVLFTIFVYLCLFPLTYRQQKYSVLTRKMQPELKAVQNKYKGKKDQASVMAQQEETQMIYDKYGISPMGSCVQLLIQMPILFALYRVFYNVPAYVGSVKSLFSGLTTGIMGVDGYADKMQTIFEAAKLKNVSVDLTTTDTSTMKNYLVDIIYKLSDSGWESLNDSFPSLSDLISSTHAALDKINYLGPLSISDTPLNQITTGWSNGEIALVIAAILVPFCAYASQVLNVKLMPQNSSDPNDQMARQMKTMNTFMPLMSLFITFTTPTGLGIYWIAGALIRAVQQYFLNKHFEKIDLNSIIEKNKEKAAAKKAKRGERQSQIYNAATMNTKKSMAEKATISTDKKDALNKAAEARSHAKSNSLAAKANLVKDFNDKKN